jgi:hypothetical protein
VVLVEVMDLQEEVEGVLVDFVLLFQVEQN